MSPGEKKLVGRRGQNSLLELVVIVAVAIGLALLIQAFLIIAPPGGTGRC